MGWQRLSAVGMVSVKRLLAGTIALVIGGAVLGAPPISAQEPDTYNMRTAVSAALQADADGVAPREALRAVGELPHLGCWQTELTEDGSARCLQRSGPYGYRPPLRANAYFLIGSLYLGWPEVPNGVQATQRPSDELARVVASQLEHGPDEMRLMPADIYASLGDRDGVERTMRRACGGPQVAHCDLRTALLLNDLDRAVASVERFPFAASNQGQQSIHVDSRVELLRAVQSAEQPDLVLRVARLLTRDYAGYPMPAVEGLRALAAQVSSTELERVVLVFDEAALRAPGVQSVSAAIVAIAGWRLLRDDSRADDIVSRWRVISESYTEKRCQGTISQLGGYAPFCATPFLELMASL